MIWDLFGAFIPYYLAVLSVFLFITPALFIGRLENGKTFKDNFFTLINCPMKPVGLWVSWLESGSRI